MLFIPAKTECFLAEDAGNCLLRALYFEVIIDPEPSSIDFIASSYRTFYYFFPLLSLIYPILSD